MRYFLLIIIFCISIFSFGQNHVYVPPVKIPMHLSGSFAELRSNHFHSGIDIKTQGVTGIPVYSVADGYISRISVSPTGFGKALYIKHPKGTTSVYGHLNKFSREVEEYIKNLQYKNKSFRIDVPVNPNMFPVKQGDEIAKSGNSGSSGGPHLHFEIRNTSTEEPMNPLKYNFPVVDKTAPKIFNLLVISKNEKSHVNYQSSDKSYPVVFYDGKYHIKNNPVIPVYGEIGFAVHTNDYFDNSYNKCGIFSMELTIDEELYFVSQMDKFSFDNTRYINSFIDYEEYIVSNRRFLKTFVDPGNKLKIYRYKRSEGIYNFNDENIHLIQIILKDTYGNTSKLEFNVESNSSDIEVISTKFTQLFNYDKINQFKQNEIELQAQEGTFYDDFKFQYKKNSATTDLFSSIHVIHKNTVPLHNSAEIKIKANNLPEVLQSKALLVNIDTITGEFYAAGGKFSNGWVNSNILNFGNYGIAVDTIPPTIISQSISNKNTLNEPNRIRFKISDDLAGIEKIEGYLDDKWALFEYDQKNDIITHYFDNERFEMNKAHKILLRITDYKNNNASYEATFWK